LDSIFQYNNIEHLHIELTNLCNASCPACPRFFKNSSLPAPGLDLNTWTLEDFKRRLPVDFLKNIKHINFCGNHGDPVACKELLDILKYLSDIKIKVIEMHSNTGGKTSKTWSEIGKLFAKNPDWIMIFSVDGLEDTNHIYRRNIKWNKVEENIKAFTQWGGKSDWDFLVFKHNEHQIEEARQKATEWGVTNFVPKIPANVDKGTKLKPMPANKNDGTTDYLIHAAENKEYRNELIDSEEEIIETLNFKPENYEKQLERPLQIMKYKGKEPKPEWDKVKIIPKCKKESGKSTIYIDANGTVVPCCWIGITLPAIKECKQSGSTTDYITHQLDTKFNEHGGLDRLNLDKYSLKEVLGFNILGKMFEGGWDKTTKEGKIAQCSDFCGGENIVDQIYTTTGNENERYDYLKDRWKERQDERRQN